MLLPLAYGWSSASFPAVKHLLPGKPWLTWADMQRSSAGVAKQLCPTALVVATDDERRCAVRRIFGGRSVLRHPDHAVAPTSQLWEAFQRLGGSPPRCVRHSGDEPFIFIPRNRFEVGCLPIWRTSCHSGKPVVRKELFSHFTQGVCQPAGRRRCISAIPLPFSAPAPATDRWLLSAPSALGLCAYQ
jgi:hypothetical protein